MAKDANVERLGEHSEPSEAVDISGLLDPIALESRLREARVRRLEALARRQTPEAGGLPKVTAAGPKALPVIPAVRSDEDGPITAHRARTDGLKTSLPDSPAIAPLAVPQRQPVEPAVPQRTGPATPVQNQAAPVQPRADIPATSVADKIAAAKILVASETDRLRGPAPAPAKRRAPLGSAIIFATGLALGGAVVAFLSISGTPWRSGDPVATATQVTASSTPVEAPKTEVAVSAVPAPEAVPVPPAVSSVPPAVATPRESAPPPAPAAARAVVVTQAQGATGGRDVAALAAPTAERALPDTAFAEARLPEPAPPPSEEIVALAPVPEEPQPGTAPVAAPDPAGSPVLDAALPSRIIVHYPASAEAAARAVETALRDAGAADVSIMPVAFAIGASNVRYYHGEDAGSAARVAALALAAGVSDPTVRDFTDFPRPPLPGRVEIWLAGAPSATRRSGAPRAHNGGAATQATASNSAPVDVLPDTEADPSGITTSVLPRDQAEAVARIVLDRSLNRLVNPRP